MKPVLMLLVAFLLAPALPAPPAAQDETPFVLGVLRRDGVVFPFAAFDGKNWDSPWPADLRSAELPISLTDVPSRWWGKAGLPSRMTVWSDGAARGTVALDRPVVMMAACLRRMAVRTDYRSTEVLPPPAERPYPKDGLVISGGQRIDAVEAVPRTSKEWPAAAVALIEPMDRAEQLAVDRFTDWEHPVKRSERRKVPVELEALYRAPMDTEGWAVYHVEAVKRYPPGKDDEGCGLVTSASGWMAIGPNGKMWRQIGARVTYCDRKGVTYFLPLGLIHARGRTYWVFQTSSYEIEAYDVVRPTPRLIEFETGYTAGSCGGI